MKKERTSQRQKGKLDGPFQVFRLVTETEDLPGKWSVSSEFFLVCLENFGPVSGFVLERQAIDDAEQWNSDFFNRLTQQIQQRRLQDLHNSLTPERQRKLLDAFKRALSAFDPASENLPTPGKTLEEGAGGESQVGGLRKRLRL